MISTVKLTKIYQMKSLNSVMYKLRKKYQL
jgi:hypothetical protein